MNQKNPKFTIGVILYTSPGTNTSILLSEFLFFNKFAELNPNTKFVFIPVTKIIESKLRTKVSMLADHVDWEILRIDHPLQLNKLNIGFSAFFSYMLRNNFFGGSLDPRCMMSYIVASYVTNELNLPLFFRLPDSEYKYLDYRKMVTNRCTQLPSGKKFVELNGKKVKMIEAWPQIKYDNVYWIANCTDKIYDWAPNVIYNDVPGLMQFDELKESLDRVLYVSDDILFGYHENLERLKFECNKDFDKRICFAGYLKGSVAEKRPKILKKIFGKNEHKIPTVIFGPGSTDIPSIQDKDNIELIEDSFQGDDYYKFLNKQMAVIHFGKGKDNYSYIAKSIYDCAVAGVPSLIYLPCDQNRIIFGDDDFYFENELDLFAQYVKLSSNEYREDYLHKQREWIETTLSNKMYPNFKFADYCESTIYNLSTKLF